MSAPATQLPPGPPPISCPRCQAVVAGRQDWCLECGAPARTRLAPAPNWKLPVGILLSLLALALVVLVIAFVALTSDSAPVPPQTTMTTAPAAVVPAG